MTQIIGLCGRLQSGKSSGCKYIAAEVMKKNGMFDYFSFEEDGELVVPVVVDPKTLEIAEGIFDPINRSEAFRSWAQVNMWPKVKIYHFADTLKWDCIKYYGVPEELAFGNKKAKDTKLDIKWGDLADIYLPASKLSKQKRGSRLTVRDLLIVHADFVRAIDPMAFVNRLMYDVDSENSGVALVGDTRYINEVNAIKERGGKLIKFTKIVEAKAHSSETQLDELNDSEFDLIIDNTNMTLEEKNEVLLKFLKELAVV